MILRALALLVGVPLLLIGLLATVIAVGMVGDPGPQGGQPPIAAQVITVVLMAGITITGAALFWLGVRKRSQRLAADTSSSGSHITTQEFDTVVRPRETAGGSTTSAYASPPLVAASNSSSVAIEQPSTTLHESLGYAQGYAQDQGDFDEQFREEVESSSPSDDGQESFQVGTTGRLIGKCGPKMSGQLHYYFVGGLVIAVGLAVMIGLQVAPGAADPATAGKVGLWLGGGLVLFGGAMIALQLTRGTPNHLAVRRPAGGGIGFQAAHRPLGPNRQLAAAGVLRTPLRAANFHSHGARERRSKSQVLNCPGGRRRSDRPLPGRHCA